MAMQPMPMPAGAFLAMPGAEAFQSMQHPGMHPEMMQAVPMQMVMGPMGPMMAAGPMPPGMAAMMPGGMAAPQLTQMLVDAARGGRSSNVFFKTRICNKWRAGSCPYGDKCTYAHGEHELRYVPPEIVAQLEAQQKLQDTMAARGGSGGGPGEGPPPRGDEGGGAGGPPAYAGMSPGGAGVGVGPGPGHQSFYKTRLCIKYMQTGYCHKAASCTFAHGYEDLRQPGTPISPGRMQQDPLSPRRMAMAPAGMAMLPAGMMGMAMAPPGAAMGGGRGMPMASQGGMPMPMPMPMPLQPGRFPGQQQQPMQRSPRGYGGGGGTGRDDPAAAARRRASTMCQIAGVGEAAAEEAQPADMQAALQDARSGAAYQQSAYADSVADYVGGQGQGQDEEAAS